MANSRGRRLRLTDRISELQYLARDAFVTITNSAYRNAQNELAYRSLLTKHVDMYNKAANRSALHVSSIIRRPRYNPSIDYRVLSSIYAEDPNRKELVTLLPYAEYWLNMQSLDDLLSERVYIYFCTDPDDPTFQPFGQMNPIYAFRLSERFDDAVAIPARIALMELSGSGIDLYYTADNVPPIVDLNDFTLLTRTYQPFRGTLSALAIFVDQILRTRNMTRHPPLQITKDLSNNRLQIISIDPEVGC